MTRKIDKNKNVYENLNKKEIIKILAKETKLLKIMPETNYNELVIRIDTKLDLLTKKVDDLSNGTTTRISALENDKADRKDVAILQTKINNDIEIRVRSLEEAKIEPSEHKAVLISVNTNNIYLRWMVGLIVILVGIMSFHILGIRLP
jgi:hypothetical protein